MIAWALVVALAGPARADVHGVPLPRGTRVDADTGRRVSGKGYRDTVDFVRKWLSRNGLAHRQLGPYRVRGVDVTRFVSEDPSTPWLAIHVWRQDGKTWIAVIERPASPPLDEAPPRE
ncbi:MAG: hypothetical protein H6708_22265 [Kofleriaceae bacterium]|nr:hypothetical protein [Kofleriaceae bacterium]